MKFRVLVVLATLFCLALPAKAEEHYREVDANGFRLTPHSEMIQPLFSSKKNSGEVLLVNASVRTLQFGRLELLGFGVGLASADPSGGLTLSINLADVRLITSHTSDRSEASGLAGYVGVSLLRDVHTKTNGVAIGFSVGWLR
jgi:hypothetical protein